MDNLKEETEAKPKPPPKPKQTAVYSRAGNAPNMASLLSKHRGKDSLYVERTNYIRARLGGKAQHTPESILQQTKVIDEAIKVIPDRTVILCLKRKRARK